MPRPPTLPPATVQTRDEQIMDKIFDNSTLPLGRVIDRAETFADLGYDWLDFVELWMDLHIDDEPDQETFLTMKVEDMIQMANKKKAATVALFAEVTE